MISVDESNCVEYNGPRLFLPQRSSLDVTVVVPDPGALQVILK